MKKLAIFFLIICDQSLKYLAVKDLLPHLGGLLTFSCNEGLSWGMKLPPGYFLLTWLICILLLLYLFAKENYNFFLGLALVGAFLNFGDRIGYGCVVDFIKLGAFPVFNLADIAISVGCGLYPWSYLKKNPPLTNIF